MEPEIAFYYGYEHLDAKTEKEMRKFLKDHDYDPDTNTIELNGERLLWGNTMKKSDDSETNGFTNALETPEENELRFLKEHNYDPVNKTINIMGIEFPWNQ